MEHRPTPTQAAPWYGCWQLVTHEPEEIVQHQNTTIANRSQLGFSLYTASHFIEARSLGARQLLQAKEPDEAEAVAAFQLLHACAGRCTWTQTNGEWTAEHHLTDALDPRLEGTTLQHRFAFDGDRCTCTRQLPAGGEVTESWRRLSGKGAAPLAGAWQSDDPVFGRWTYLVTGGHYGVVRNVAQRLRKAPGDDYSPAEIATLFEEFGFNIGARLETAQSFDHWPFMAQFPGYEARKHPTFQLVSVAEEAFSAAIPPHLPAQEWKRVGQ